MKKVKFIGFYFLLIWNSIYSQNNPVSGKLSLKQCIETGNGDILAGTWGGAITVYDSQWHFKKNIFFSSGPEEYNLVWSFIKNDDGTIGADSTAVEVDVPNYEAFTGPENFGEVFNQYERKVLEARNAVVKEATENYLSKMAKNSQRQRSREEK